MIILYYQNYILIIIGFLKKQQWFYHYELSELKCSCNIIDILCIMLQLYKEYSIINIFDNFSFCLIVHIYLNYIY